MPLRSTVIAVLGALAPGLAFAANGVHVAVTPLTAEGAQGTQPALGFFLAEGAFAAVAGAEGATAVDRLHFIDHLRELKALEGTAPEALALQAGTLAGATQMMLGSYARSGAVARVNLRIVDVQTRRVVAGLQASAPADDAMGLRDEVFCAVSRHFSSRPDAACTLDASTMTRSPAAQREFAESLLALYQGRQREARERLRSALERDPAFAQASAVRDALYFSAGLGNSWTYRFESDQASGDMVRTVVAVQRDPGGGDLVTTAYRVPVVVTPVWGACRATVREKLLLDHEQGWAQLLEEAVEYECAKLPRRWGYRTEFRPGIPYLPLRASATEVRLEPRSVIVTSELPGVASSAWTAICTVSTAPAGRIGTPMGDLDGIAITKECRREGARHLQVLNAERAAAYRQRVERENAEVGRLASEPGGLWSLFGRALEEAVFETVPEPEDFEASAYGIFDTESLSGRRVFVPGVGVISFAAHNARSGRARPEAGGRADLTGMTIQRLSRLTTGVSRGPEESDSRLLGETHAAEPSRLGGRPGSVEMGLIGILHPAYERIRLTFPDERIDMHRIGHLLGLGGSYWLGGVLRIGGAVETLGGTVREDLTSEAQDELYGAEYNAAEYLALEANLRGRVAPVGWASILQLEAGTRVHYFHVGNKAEDTGTYGRELNEDYVLWRHFGGLVAQVNLHDRFIFEGAYRVSRWVGTFGWADVGRRIDLVTHGPRGRVCVGTSATVGDLGFGACITGFAEFPLETTDSGGYSGSPTSVGGSLDIVFRSGRFDPRRGL